jgi:hypothetical protein
MTGKKKKTKKPASSDQSLRQHLLDLLHGGNAHATFDDAVKDFPPALRGKKPDVLPHSPWMLLEHLRIAQHDILEFSRNADHVSPPWPAGYWPTSEAPPSPEAWNKSIRQFREELKAMEELVANRKINLFAKIPWGDSQTILREALLLADHNAYHLGQFIDLRRVLGAWK